MAVETKFDVFLSHNSKDKPTVRQLAEALRQRGLKVWLDEWELVPGRPWQRALEEVIQTIPSAAVLVGKDGLGPWEIPEMEGCLSEFVSRKLPVIPVLLPDAPRQPDLPLFLKRFAWVDLRAGGLSEANLDRLEWGITGRKPSSEPQPKPLFEPAIEPATQESEVPILQTPSSNQLLGSGGQSGYSHQWLVGAAVVVVFMVVFLVVAKPHLFTLQSWSISLSPPTPLPLTGQKIQDKLRDGTLGPEMVVIREGTFLMGSPDGEEGRDADDEHQHPVEIKRLFAIGKYEVTFQEYDYFAEATAREKPKDEGWGRGQRPVINVSWYDAIAYAEWLSAQTDQRYRLPTESEWEYAARAGTTTPFYFGTTISTYQANYNGHYMYAGKNEEFYRGKTLEVGRLQYPNRWELYDVHGNVWEWTCSEYDKNYSGTEQRCANNQNLTTRRVLRGGSWNDEPWLVRVAARDSMRPRSSSRYAGIRLARDL